MRGAVAETLKYSTKPADMVADPEWFLELTRLLREVALKTGLNIVASSGPYLEKFESTRIHKPVELLASLIDKE
ncbi:hypothetical protein MJI95_35175, partial [Salmonella enterica subsp. enterica serovar Kentucky]|nr:hypothetical protein [Salmonella enterica subsp. enterica serovar Kentucky]